MARPTSKGSVEWVGDPSAPKPSDHWRTCVTIGKSRRWISLPSSITRTQGAKASATAKRYAGLASAGTLRSMMAPAPPSGVGESLAEWAGKWFASRLACGRMATRFDQATFATWVLSRLGRHPVASISTADIEAWVEWISERVQAGALVRKTAQNAWCLVSRAMAEASKGKVPSLRCRSDNPTLGVQGPERGGDALDPERDAAILARRASRSGEKGRRFHGASDI